MKKEGKVSYRRLLLDGKLSHKSLERLLVFLRQKGMHVEKIPKEILTQVEAGRILKGHELSVCYGKSSWEGLIIGFPGTRQELSTQNVGTPYLRMLLYPILDLYIKLQRQSERVMPCLYLFGERFNDVFLRKFRFFKSLIPHVIVITNDLYQCAIRREIKLPISIKPKIDENYCQKKLMEKMISDAGIELPLGKKPKMHLDLIANEVPTVAGTVAPERLDILGYDTNDHSLVVFELKGPDAGTIELENLFLQGMEHRDWIEENKMAIKFAFDGPNGRRINTRKRVKLVLGFCGEDVPPLFHDLKAKALKKDKHLQIEFSRLIPPSTLGKMVEVGSFC